MRVRKGVCGRAAQVAELLMTIGELFVLVTVFVGMWLWCLAHHKLLWPVIGLGACGAVAAVYVLCGPAPAVTDWDALNEKRIKETLMQRIAEDEDSTPSAAPVGRPMPFTEAYLADHANDPVPNDALEIAAPEALHGFTQDCEVR